MTRARRACALLVACGAVAAFGCSTPSDAQPYGGACTPMHALTWTPAASAADVPRDTVVSVRFDAYPDPDTVDLGGFLVTTGLFYHPGTTALDLIDQTITYAPAGAWRADLGYNINVRAGLVSLQGCAAVPEQQSFRTATAAPMMAAPPAAPTPYAAVQPIFSARCSGAACHRATTADGGGCLAAPAAGLSLCDAEIVGALLGVPSRQVGRLHLVEDRDSARSYLLRKLLPGDRPDEPAPTTLGHRDPPGDPLTASEMHLIASWIDAGLPN
jgi:Bacterial Ig-like domain